VKTSTDRQIIVLFQEIGVAEFNGNVIILIGSREIAVFFAYALCIVQGRKKQPRSSICRASDGLKLQYAFDSIALVAFAS